MGKRHIKTLVTSGYQEKQTEVKSATKLMENPKQQLLH